MNKTEILKQADYAFQRGNREMAERLLTELLTEYPSEESAWMLSARVAEKKERKIECYRRALKISPNNAEAKLALTRIQSLTQSLPKHTQSPKIFNKILRGAFVVAVILAGLASAAFVIAKQNPSSDMAQLIAPAVSESFKSNLASNVAANTRAKIGASYPQYVSLANMLISVAASNADNGMDGAPERPGAEIMPSEKAGKETRAKAANALPQPGSLSSVTLNENQLTSWLALEMKNIPDLPLSGVQVYLRDGKIQIWGMINGSANATSALILGNLNIDLNQKPNFKIESIQIGREKIPVIALSQAEAWVNQALSDKIDEQAAGLKIVNVSINHGLLTISGMR